MSFHRKRISKFWSFKQLHLSMYWETIYAKWKEKHTKSRWVCCSHCIWVRDDILHAPDSRSLWDGSVLIWSQVRTTNHSRAVQNKAERNPNLKPSANTSPGSLLGQLFTDTIFPRPPPAASCHLEPCCFCSRHQPAASLSSYTQIYQETEKSQSLFFSSTTRISHGALAKHGL